MAVILIIGGAHCGKRDYARTVLGYSPEQMSARLDLTPVLYDLHELLHEQEDYQELLPMLLQKEVIICNEVGCGVIPMEESERNWRETVGRACCELAKKAQSVIRVQCGIGTTIKGG